MGCSSSKPKVEKHDNDKIRINPSPGFVVEYFREDGSKVHVNVMHHQDVHKWHGVRSTSNIEDHGSKRILYTFLMPIDDYVQHQGPDDKVCLEVRSQLISNFDEELENYYNIIIHNGQTGHIKDIAIPKEFLTKSMSVKDVDDQKEEILISSNNDLGSSVEHNVAIHANDKDAEEEADPSGACDNVGTVFSEVGEALSLVQEEVGHSINDGEQSKDKAPAVAKEHVKNASENASIKEPNTIKGFLMKEGHEVKNWKKRYFVMELGVMKYYVSPLHHYPYGEELKGELNLAGYEVAVVNRQGRIHLKHASGHFKEMMLECGEVQLVTVWLQALDEHIAYANARAPPTSTLTSSGRVSTVRGSPGPHAADTSGSTAATAASLPSLDVSSGPPQASSDSPTSHHSPDPSRRTSFTRNGGAPVPPRRAGWATKEGHVVKSMRRRYFVLDHGILSYYVDLSLEPPYGKDLKGTLTLHGHEIAEIDLVTNFSISLQGPNSQSLFMKFGSAQECGEWETALHLHIAFANVAFDEDECFSRMSIVPDDNDKGGPHRPHLSHSNSGSTSRRISINQAQITLATSGRYVTFNEYTLPNEDANAWAVFLHFGEEIIATNLVNKPNPVGKPLMRQIILTNHRRLLYLDPAKMEILGSLDLTAPDRAVSNRGPTTLMIRVNRTSKEYKFIDELFGAQFWVDAIAALN